MGRRRDRGCPCWLPAAYERCCGQFLGGAAAPTAELLMRSRYTAFVRQDAEHLLRSWHPSTRPATLSFEPTLRWTRLEVLETAAGDEGDETGTVRFRATHVQDGVVGVLEELSRFRRHDGRWTYVSPVEGGSPW